MRAHRIDCPTGRNSPPLVHGRQDKGVVDLSATPSSFVAASRARLAPTHGNALRVAVPAWNLTLRRALLATFARPSRVSDCTRKIMARKTRTVSEDITEIEREIAGLMTDLESRIGRLNSLSRKGASNAASEAGDYVSETLSETAQRLRNGAHAVTDEASRLGSDALRRVEEEVEQRPLLTLAIAAGIGFLAGMAGRRH
jgi:ElaB/YqjD/DUF883 family membrane-anchored ribosome-binding protein